MALLDVQSSPVHMDVPLMCSLLPNNEGRVGIGGVVVVSVTLRSCKQLDTR